MTRSVLPAVLMLASTGVASLLSVSSSSATSVEEARSCLARYGTHIHPDDYGNVDGACVGYLMRSGVQSAYNMAGPEVRQVANECRSTYGATLASSRFDSVASSCRPFYFPIVGQPAFQIQLP